MRVFVTGGTGFVGSWVVARLVADGHRVVVLARDPDKVAGFVDDPRIEFVHGTMTSEHAIRQGLAGADACVHIALSWGDSATEMAAADTMPSIALFEAAADAGVQRIVYTSSVAVFDEPFDVYDDDSAPRPARYYGSTKAATEAYLVAIGETRGVRVNAIRPGYTFGNPVVAGAPIQRMREFPSLVRAAMRTEPIDVVHEDGLQFIWAGDLAQVFAAVLGSSRERRYYTALSPHYLTWEQVARIAIEAVGSTSEIRVADRGLPPAEPHYSVEAIARDFGLRFDARQHFADHFRHLAKTG